ncbi:hypothetical protein H8959_006681 [Pygathrix nigripes]
MLKQNWNQAIRFFVLTSLRSWYRGDDTSKLMNPLVAGVCGATVGAAGVFGNASLHGVEPRMWGLEGCATPLKFAHAGFSPTALRPTGQKQLTHYYQHARQERTALPLLQGGPIGPPGWLQGPHLGQALHRDAPATVIKRAYMLLKLV